MTDPGPVPSDESWDLPDDAPSRRLASRMPLDEYLRRIEEVRSWFPRFIPTPEERLRSRVDVTFELEARESLRGLHPGAPPSQ